MDNFQFEFEETNEGYRIVGKDYLIRYCGSGDGDPEYVSLWACTCPGHKYRGDCKHLRGFLQWRQHDDQTVPVF